MDTFVLALMVLGGDYPCTFMLGLSGVVIILLVGVYKALGGILRI